MPAHPLDNGRVTNFIRFSADDWRELARGQRALAHQAEQDAARQANPSMRDLFLKTAERCRVRAEQCENAARVL